MGDGEATIEVTLRLESPDENDDYSSLRQFLKLYDLFKEELCADPIIESFTIPGDFYFIVESIDTSYDGEWEDSEDNYLGFVVATNRRLTFENSIEFIWIKKDFRRKGFATEAIKLLQDKMDNLDWYDFPIDDDSKAFWETTGLKCLYLRNEEGYLELCDEAAEKYSVTSELRRQAVHQFFNKE